MTLSCQDLSPCLSILRPQSGRVSSGIAGELADLGPALAARGIELALLDLSGCRGGHSLLAGLVEASARLGNSLRLVVCGLDPSLSDCLGRAGLSGALDLVADRDAALAHPAVRARLATGGRVVLAPGWGLQPVLPLSGPAALLDLLGQPVIARVCEALRRLGLRDLVLDGSGPVAASETLTAALPASVTPWFLGEPTGRGLAAALADQARRGGLPNETVLLAPDRLPGPGLAAALLSHRRSGADQGRAAGETVAGFDATGKVGRFGGECRCDGLAILSAASIAGWETAAPGGQADALAGCLGGNETPAGHPGPADATDRLASAGDYFRLLRQGLDGRADLRPLGEQVRPGVWLAHGARLSPRAAITGPCYIGPGASVEAGASLSGHVVIGEGALVGPGAVIRDSVIRPATRVEPGAIVSSMIAAGVWAIDHRFDLVATTAPLDGVVPIDSAAPAVPAEPRPRPGFEAIPLLARTA
ncbi:MAG: hypothetical protein RLZZ528_2371 [Pseudomonadota bacterium]